MADLEYKVGEYEKANNYFQQRIISAGEQVKELQSRLEAAQKAIKERDQVCADAMRAHANTLSRLDSIRELATALESGAQFECVKVPLRRILDLVVETRCPVCGGNDREAPCAYPSEGRPECLRNKRLVERR